MGEIRHILVAAAAIAAAVCAFSAPARADGACAEDSYAYAGFGGGAATRGVSATIDQAGPLQVSNGHVAGWIGVVEPDATAWLQVGLSALPDDTTSGIYYEVAFPGQGPVYHLLQSGVGAGERHRFAVLEVPRRPSWWRVWLDGRPATPPLHLAGSHGRWTAEVLGESWAGMGTGMCNRYSYDFSGVSLLAADGGLPVYQSGDYTVLRRSRSSFIATSIGNPVTD